MPPRVVFDTNIMISGLLWRGPPYQCLQLARSGVVEACYCEPMMNELSAKLTTKFGFSAESTAEVLADWRSKAAEVLIPGEVRAVLSDPDDDVFLECALAAGANLLVSGDRHLLALGRYQEVEIVTATEFLRNIPSVDEEAPR